MSTSQHNVLCLSLFVLQKNKQHSNYQRIKDKLEQYKPYNNNRMYLTDELDSLNQIITKTQTEKQTLESTKTRLLQLKLSYIETKLKIDLLNTHIRQQQSNDPRIREFYLVLNHLGIIQLTTPLDTIIQQAKAPGFNPAKIKLLNFCKTIMTAENGKRSND